MPSLSGVEPWRVDDRLPPSTYLAKPKNLKCGDSSNQNPQIKLDWRVVAGEWQGSEQMDSVTFTDASLGVVAQLLEACAIAIPETEFPNYAAMRDWVVEQLKGEPITNIVVRLEDDRQGRIDESTGEVRKWTVVKGYKRPDEGDLSSDASEFNGAPKLAGPDGIPPGWTAGQPLPKGWEMGPGDVPRKKVPF